MLAAVFTLSFIVLIYILWRILRAVDSARNKLQGQRGSVEFHVRGDSAPSKDESLSLTDR